MQAEFNPSEILEIAIEIERTGAAFYRAARDPIVDVATKRLLGELAAWEDAHAIIFEAMKERYDAGKLDTSILDPNHDAAKYLHAVAHGVIFPTDATVEDLFKRGRTPEAILETALSMEKDAVVFYLSLLDTLPNPADRKVIDAILKEERSHILSLSDALRRERGAAAETERTSIL